MMPSIDSRSRRPPLRLLHRPTHENHLQSFSRFYQWAPTSGTRVRHINNRASFLYGPQSSLRCVALRCQSCQSCWGGGDCLQPMRLCGGCNYILSMRERIPAHRLTHVHLPPSTDCSVPNYLTL
ncbi:hypothetical protein BGZ63DRAFT_121765 [Mariannaea sp. PMI_226]|nr:hypothetical protein BGZ63DRAFT_121765 [Mariannaea sp. PMI_226]